MTLRSSPLSKHVIKAMLQDDGYISLENIGKAAKYVVHIRISDGSHQPLCCVSKANFSKLLQAGILKDNGTGKYTLASQEEKFRVLMKKAIQHSTKRESAEEIVRKLQALKLDKVTGAFLKPGEPENCEGNGKTVNVDGDVDECCCDECDYYLQCFPEQDDRERT